MRRLIPMILSLWPGSSIAQAEPEGVQTCRVQNNPVLQATFNDRTFRGSFKTFDRNYETVVRFKPNNPSLERPGQLLSDRLSCVRFLTPAEAQKQADVLKVPALTLDFFTNMMKCDAAIIADWEVGESMGRVLWCSESYAPQAKITGVYWLDSRWSNTDFIDVWEGRWE